MKLLLIVFLSFSHFAHAKPRVCFVLDSDHTSDESRRFDNIAEEYAGQGEFLLAIESTLYLKRQSKHIVELGDDDAEIFATTIPGFFQFGLAFIFRYSTDLSELEKKNHSTNSREGLKIFANAAIETTLGQKAWNRVTSKKIEDSLLENQMIKKFIDALSAKVMPSAFSLEEASIRDHAVMLMLYASFVQEYGRVITEAKWPSAIAPPAGLHVLDDFLFSMIEGKRKDLGRLFDDVFQLYVIGWRDQIQAEKLTHIIGSHLSTDDLIIVKIGAAHRNVMTNVEEHFGNRIQIVETNPGLEIKRFNRHVEDKTCLGQI